MKAHKGDKLVVASRRVGGPSREGVIVAIEGQAGAPPYRVRWAGDEDTHLVFPGPDAYLEPK